VTEVKIALLIAGSESTRMDSATTSYNLFGEEYAVLASAFDKGTTITEKDIPQERRRRLRKLYTTTVILRNSCNVDAIRGTCLAPN